MCDASKLSPDRISLSIKTVTLCSMLPDKYHCTECMCNGWCLTLYAMYSPEKCMFSQVKDKMLYMVVRVLDTHKKEWSYMHPAGPDPPQRGGQTVRPSIPSYF